MNAERGAESGGTAIVLAAQLRRIVGDRYVLCETDRQGSFAKGYRVGGGPAAAVVRPGTLFELWKVFEACIAADHVVIPQAANTGLTGGSAPFGAYDRPVIVVNTMRIKGVRPILNGEQVICLAGATLHDLELALAPLGREPHSVIGSSCIGASVVGGVCNNSGGALVQRGPAYTEYALYAQVEADGSVTLRNHLGVRLDGGPEQILDALEHGRFSGTDIVSDGRAASAAQRYRDTVRKVGEASPARFNADPAMLNQCSGSAGKVLVFAVRLDTFPAPTRSAVFYVGTNNPNEFTRLRRRLLEGDRPLPVSGEYIHRDAFDLAARYGKDTVAAIRWMGTKRLPLLFGFKNWIDRLATRFPGLPSNLSDSLLQKASGLLPGHLPLRIRHFREKFEHHLIIKVTDDAIEPTRDDLAHMFPSGFGDVIECTSRETQAAMLHRFAVAGAAIRFRAIHSKDIEDLVAIDVALRRNDQDWVEKLPAELNADVVGKLYYGHFFCHVFHQDYLLRKGVDPATFEHRVLELLAARGAEYPAEHNVGHLYAAKPALAEHYRALDPTNRMNPGIGQMSRSVDYR